jgi:CRP/FNR family transcriptional regulator, cyclic AMP receptor protein
MQGLELFGYLGAALTLATFSMKTMLQLRRVGIVANLAFIAYGASCGVLPVLLLHLALLPLNVWRLRQLQRLTRQIAQATAGGVSLDWLQPYSRRRSVRAGEQLFAQGDTADEVMFVLSGRFRAVQADVVLGPGEVFGELGLIAKGHRRTQTVRCESDGELLVISYDEVRQMYFQNPSFGFFFLELVAERLTRDAQHAGPVQAAPAA